MAERRTVQREQSGLESRSPFIAAKVRTPRVAALPRDRLDTRFRELWDRRAALIVAPAGSGKTTLLAQWAATPGLPVAWYRAEPSDGDASTVLGYLETALCGALYGPKGGWDSVATAAEQLERWRGERALLVVDDLHTLQGTPAERTLGQLIEYLPDGILVVMASRQPPQLRNLSRLRLADALVELGPDDLRFRSWEVERLFSDFYHSPLPPEELAALARRTEGWAAGLQLFHLATRGKLPDERRRTLAALGPRRGLVHEYLTENVLADLRGELRAFLLETCVLGRLSGTVCDELRGARGSEELLVELEHEQVFTQVLDDGWYRYHEVLRSHLEAVLVEEIGESAARERYQLAGELLEKAEALPDALAAYARAQDWASVGRLLGNGGETIALDAGAWLDRLPPGLRRQDPWLLLASARRLRAAGRWHDALADYRAAEDQFGPVPAAELCRKERAELRLWTGPAQPLREGWLGLLRSATIREPSLVVSEAMDSGPLGRLVAGLALLLAGRLTQARIELVSAAESSAYAPTLSIAARMAAGAASLLAGDTDASLDVEWAAEEAEHHGALWLALVGQALKALGSGDGQDAPQAWTATATAVADPWVSGLAVLVEGFGALRRQDDADAGLAERLHEAAERFAALDALTLAAWCTAIAAAVRGAQGTLTVTAGREALRTTRTVGVPGAEAFAHHALAACDARRADAHRRQADALFAECGLLPPPTAAASTSASVPLLVAVGAASAPPTVVMRLFGRFELHVDGEPVDLPSVKPLARRLLRLLALHTGRPVHREALVDALWPEVTLEVGTRNLHVHLSGLRAVLEPRGDRAVGVLLAREGDAYRLALPPDVDCDLLEFDRAMARGRKARVAGQTDALVEAFSRALDLHRSELLPEDGPAEWLLGERDRCRADVVDAAASLVEVLMARGDHPGAVVACTKGLRVDRYADILWRRLIAIHEEDGEPAAAARARRRYEEVLRQVGV